MKHTNKTVLLLSLITVACLLLVGYVILKNTGGADAEHSHEEKYLLISADPDDVRSISFARGDAELSFSRDGDGWLCDSDPTFPLNTGKIDAMASAASSVASYKLIEGGDESEFGFDEPELVITADFGGNKVTLTLGSFNSFTSSRYLKCSIDNKIYLVDDSITAPFQCELADLILLDRIPADITVSAVLSVTLTLDGKTNEIKDDLGTNALVAQLLKLSTAKYSDHHATPSEMEAEYGIPSGGVMAVRYRSSSDGGEREYTVSFGEKNADSGSVFFSLPDSNIVYSASGEVYGNIMSYITYHPVGEGE